MGLEEYLPSGFLFTTVEKAAGYARSRSMWPVFFGLACCAFEAMQAGSPQGEAYPPGSHGAGAPDRDRLTITRLVSAGLVILGAGPGVMPAVRETYRLRPDGHGCRLEFRLTLDGIPVMAGGTWPAPSSPARHSRCWDASLPSRPATSRRAGQRKQAPMIQQLRTPKAGD